MSSIKSSYITLTSSNDMIYVDISRMMNGWDWMRWYCSGISVRKKDETYAQRDARLRNKPSVCVVVLRSIILTYETVYSLARSLQQYIQNFEPTKLLIVNANAKPIKVKKSSLRVSQNFLELSQRMVVTLKRQNLICRHIFSDIFDTVNLHI